MATPDKQPRRASTAKPVLGPDDETITLSGVLLPELTGGRVSLMAIQLMAETGKAWSLIEGSGAIHGMFVIESLTRSKTVFFKDGSARRIEFTITLKRTDEGLKDMFGDLSQQFEDLATQVSDTVGGLYHEPARHPDKIGGSNTPAYTLKIDGVDITGKVNENC